MIGCTNEKNVTYTTYKLTGEAKCWWQDDKCQNIHIFAHNLCLLISYFMLFCSILFHFCIFCVFLGFWRKGTNSGNIELKGQKLEEARSFGSRTGILVVRSIALCLCSSALALEH